MSAIFPSGLALGDAFYDRVAERTALLHNIHTVLDPTFKTYFEIF